MFDAWGCRCDFCGLKVAFRGSKWSEAKACWRMPGCLWMTLELRFSRALQQRKFNSFGHAVFLGLFGILFGGSLRFDCRARHLSQRHLSFVKSSEIVVVWTLLRNCSVYHSHVSSRTTYCRHFSRQTPSVISQAPNLTSAWHAAKFLARKIAIFINLSLLRICRCRWYQGLFGLNGTCWLFVLWNKVLREWSCVGHGLIAPILLRVGAKASGIQPTWLGLEVHWVCDWLIVLVAQKVCSCSVQAAHWWRCHHLVTLLQVMIGRRIVQ